ncbi:YveK family protein [Virgibacillus sp. FSP13]
MNNTTAPHKEIVQIIKKRLVFIFLCTGGFVGIAAMISYYLLNPVYQSSSQFVVTQQPNEAVQFGINEIETNLGLINTYSEIIENPIILSQVMEKLDTQVSLDEFRKQIEVSSGENSQVVTVSAIGETPEVAAKIANLVVEAFREEIMTIMQIKNVFVLSQADPDLSMEPIHPRPILNMLIAGLIGIVTSIGLTFLFEFMNTKVKAVSDLEELGITVLGVITKIEKQQSSTRRKSTSVVEKEGEDIETF